MIAPFDGVVSPHSNLITVDFPAPFGPSKAVTPGQTEKLTSETATTAPNHFDTLSKVIVGETSSAAGSPALNG